MRVAAMWVRSASAIALTIAGPTAWAAAAPSGIEVVVVTAQKSEQSANAVGMSITAATGGQLRERGIESVTDLPRLVPGLTIQESNYQSMSITLRGVGFFNSDLSTPPAVTVYVDEAPLSYPAITKLAAFDLARVEVLKGPQGTLFGQNATGGAVNYIAAKPTGAFEAGADLTYGRFNRLQVGGFVSGPLSDQLSARVAVQVTQSDAWQESVTRSADELGRVREFQGRATFDWHPDERFVSRLTLTMTHDGSDSAAGQFIAPIVSFPGLEVPGLLTFPVVTEPRSADWTPVRPDNGKPFPYENDITLYHGTWRNDYRVNDAVTLTSLTSYVHFDMSYGQDADGTPFHLIEFINRDGRISSFFQELRASGRDEKVNWLVGANYSHDDIRDRPLEFFGDNESSHLLQFLDPEAFADESLFPSRTRATTYAAFGHVEYMITDQLRLEAAARYNVDRRTFDNCGIVVTDHFVRFWNLFRGGAPPLTEIGDCFTLDSATFAPVDNVHSELNQDNVSWRAGVNWMAQPDLLIYANVSKGYKAGTVPLVAASTTVQFASVPQESLLAYEAGFKAALFGGRAQLNAAAFYYHYVDKQLRGAVLDPVFGPLEALVSIPKSHVQGFEAQLVAQPIDGLTIDTAITYVDSEVDEFTGFDALANFRDQSGTPFPFAPKWASVTNVDYTFPVASNVKGFVGGSLTCNSKTFAGIGALDVLRIEAFALLDLRAGVELADNRYHIWVWGKNVTDQYYWNNVVANPDAIVRFPGQPATYGISISARF